MRAWPIISTRTRSRGTVDARLLSPRPGSSWRPHAWLVFYLLLCSVRARVVFLFALALILRCCPARLGQELQLRKVITQHYGPDSLSEAQIQTVIAQLKAQRAQLETQVRLV